MCANDKAISVVVADDDPDDRMFVKEAFEENSLTNPLHFVEDGEELMDYFYRRGKYEELSGQPLPGLLLLDLNMPKMDGREVLAAMKSDDKLRRIPVVVLTTSKAEEDVLRTYDLGVNSFVTKPVNFEGLVEIVRSMSQYWLQIVTLPA